jgi:hypothetical protein
LEDPRVERLTRLMAKYILGEDIESQGMDWIQLMQDRVILSSRLL